ncbi:hypothetical protein JCGZ_03654 [Jatropha curcas]|uniref:Uncharacterized protein n=1 Tax=Jatropha curcas TaxID=180498 RepID=A0A067L9I2_JATCU|nr:hypothetical protein JCGZ_03654 [Jatropha curcas]
MAHIIYIVEFDGSGNRGHAALVDYSGVICVEACYFKGYCLSKGKEEEKEEDEREGYDIVGKGEQGDY